MLSTPTGQHAGGDDAAQNVAVVLAAVARSPASPLVATLADPSYMDRLVQRALGPDGLPQVGWLSGDFPWNFVTRSRTLVSKGAAKYPEDLWSKSVPDLYVMMFRLQMTSCVLDGCAGA